MTTMFSFMPQAGINTVAEEAALHRMGEAPRLYVRDAVNVEVSAAGRLSLRPDVRRVSPVPYRNLWQSPLHGDVFGTLGAGWVRIDSSNWSHEALAAIGEGEVSHAVLNNRVAVAGPAGIFTFDGATAQRLTLDTPGAPLVSAGTGSLPAGTYGTALTWMRGALESALSAVTFTEVGEGGALDVVMPLALDPSVTGVRLYLSRHNGGELLLAGEYPVPAPALHVPLLPEPGRAPPFQDCVPMPTGRWLHYWRGRLLTARANMLRWSQALAWHLHDPVAGFVQMPQRITFVQPVEGGVWVGQVDHVAFLAGSGPGELTLARRNTRAPVPGSAISLPAELLGGDLAQGGRSAALWLAENGYVAGTADGQAVELHAGVMSGISASGGQTASVSRRVATVVW